MAISSGWEHCAILERPHMPKDHSTLAESIKIEVAFRVENELKLIAAGVKLITVKRRVGSGERVLETARARLTSPRLRGEVEIRWRISGEGAYPRVRI